jgi:hypothetical protein
MLSGKPCTKELISSLPKKKPQKNSLSGKILLLEETQGATERTPFLKSSIRKCSLN